MKNLVIILARKILDIEHSIYCHTDCRVEFPLHRAYYNYREKKYNEYLEEKHNLVIQ